MNKILIFPLEFFKALSMIIGMSCNTLSNCYYQFLRLKIADVIPVDKTLHVIVGYLLMLFILKKTKANFPLALIAVALLALVKEGLDSRVLNYTFEEGLIDFLASIAIPTLMIGIRRLKTGKFS